MFCSVLEREKSENLKITAESDRVSWFKQEQHWPQLSNSISRKPQSQKHQAPVPANKKLKRAEEVLKLDKVPIWVIIFQRANFLTLRSVNLVNPFREPQGNCIVGASCGVSPLGIFTATDFPRLPFFEIEFLCDVFFRFPILNWHHKLKFENPRLLYVFCAPVY